MTARLIPAHAGKTWWGGGCQVFSGAHPRSRGENRSSTVTRWAGGGSSPLTRGKPHGIERRQSCHRLIPAHAGKTPLMMRGRRSLRAHPRSRGENIIRSDKPEAAEGSSPLTRGKRAFATRWSSASGLIPAHAGKTAISVSLPDQIGAHPRSRGENLGLTHARVEVEGSSPLTRGKPRLARRGVVRRGLIPAHAGKTEPRKRRTRPARAHPRSRGENEIALRARMRVSGSSPLTRGKRE